jgi:hypothetical protein
MSRFTLKLRNEETEGKEQQRSLEVENKKIKEVLPEKTLIIKESRSKKSPGRSKGPVIDAALKKDAVIRSYCTKQDKLLFAEYCRKNNISESAYLEQFVKKAIKTFTKKG